MATGYQITYGTRSNEEPEQRPDQGNVSRVCRDWMVHEDGCLAYQLQEEEKDKHYGHNRVTRKTTREDIINAKIVQHEEELRLQEEKMREIEHKRKMEEQINESILQHAKELAEQEAYLSQLETRRRISENDARVAHEVQQRLQEEESKHRQQAKEDERIAQQVMERLLVEESERQKEQENEDERIARLLQEKEQRRFQRYKEKKEERELARERKRLERSIAQQSQGMNTRQSSDYDTEDSHYADVSSESQGSGNRPRYKGRETRLVRIRDSDGRLEDVGDFSDFFIPPSQEMDEGEAKELQENQDAELARLLQEQEHKRGGKPNGDKQKQLEQKDAELARVIQEQEKLKLRKLKNRMKQMSLHERNMAERDHPPRPPDRSLSIPESTGTQRSNHSYHSSSDEQGEQPPLPARNYTNARTNYNSLSGQQRTPSDDDTSPLAQHIMERDQEIRLRNLESKWQPPLDQAPPSYPSQHSPRSPPGGENEEALPPFSRNPPSLANKSPGEENSSPGGFTTTYNIAAAIDPTYNRRTHNVAGSPEFRTGLNRGHTLPPPPSEDVPNETVAVITHHGQGRALPDFNYSDDEYEDEAPAMMPVQGQRRLKGRKSGGPGDKRSSCKQQ